MVDRPIDGPSHFHLKGRKNRLHGRGEPMLLLKWRMEATFLIASSLLFSFASALDSSPDDGGGGNSGGIGQQVRRKFW